MESTVDKLSKIIAERNDVQINERAFTAEDVATYIMCYCGHVSACNGDAKTALNDLFFN